MSLQCHTRILAKISSGRAARSIWLAGTSRPWFLARTPRTMFTMSRRFSVVPNQHQEEVQQGEKLSEVERPRFEPLPDDDSLPPMTYHLPIALALGCVCLMGYAVYNIYGIVTMWPEAVRDDLRQGVKHRNKGNLPLSIQHFQQAWETAKSLPLDSFGPDPLLKTSGIAIVLAGVLEDDDKKEEAYKVYQESLWQIQSAYLDLPPDAPQPDLGKESLKLTLPERLRAAALACKLGLMASELEKPKEEEKWLTWSMNAIRKVMEVPAGSETKEVAQIPSSLPRVRQLHIMAADMRLPLWARDNDLAAPFEALGKFYWKGEQKFYALPFYLQAVELLIPPPILKITTSPEDRCRGAQLMQEISLIVIINSTTLGIKDPLADASSWAQKALDVATVTRQSHKGKPLCELIYIELSFHRGLIHRFSEEYDEAREMFETVVKDSNAMGLNVIAASAQAELEKIDLEIRGKDKTVAQEEMQKLDPEIRDNNKDETVCESFSMQ